MKPEIGCLRDMAQTVIMFSHQELHEVTKLIKKTSLAAFSLLEIV